MAYPTTISDHILTDGDDRLVLVEAQLTQDRTSVAHLRADELKVERQRINEVGVVGIFNVDCPIEKTAWMEKNRHNIWNLRPFEMIISSLHVAVRSCRNVWLN